MAEQDVFEKDVVEAELDFAAAIHDTKQDQGEEAAEQGAWDLSIGVALAYPEKVAHEFLRRQWGFVPEEYKKIVRRAREGAAALARQERDRMILPHRREAMLARLAERKAERIKDR